MVNIRNTNEIISSLIDFYKLVKPNLDTKPGTVTRDVFISPLASQLSILYDHLSTISSKQSLRSVIGSDLDKFAKNFGISRRQASSSSGIALLTFASVDGNISINKGDLVFSSSGVSFSVNTNNRINSSNSNFYKSVALKYKADLDLLGITDQYALEISVTASTAGSFGNIAKYSLSRTNIPGVSNVTNTIAFSSGLDSESDSLFKNRILSLFSGSSVGTNLGYFNAASSVDNILDVYVVEPNDVLMERDGAIVEKNVDGSLSIVKEGSGGKVDVVILGSNTVEASDSFIYLDKSNKSDPTSEKNNYVIGQILSDSNKTISKKRADNIKSGILPTQPVNSIIEVSGSLSGSNFKEKTVDSNGIVSGNYEIVKDSGYYANSSWGLDTFKWISDRISNFQEERIKNQQDGQDELTYTGVKKISKIEQTIFVSNENSKVTSDRSILQLLHYPVTAVTRVFNTNTGERYIISNQNLDGQGSINTTGRIKITGNTLPSQSDVLQVDYSWIVNFDPNLDFDGLYLNNNSRVVEDSVDWGFSSLVKEEKIKFIKDTSGTFFVGETTLPINTVLFAKKYKEVFGKLTKITSGKYVNRLSITIENIPYSINSVDSIKLYRTNKEIYKTYLNDGLYESYSSLFVNDVVYTLNITLPSDALGNEDDFVSVILNLSDTFSVDSLNGSSSNYTVSIPESNVNESVDSLNMLITYISASNNLYSGAISTLPSSRLSNGFFPTLVGKQNLNINNNIKTENATVQLNTDGDLYVEISVTNDYTNINTDSIVSIISLTSGLEYWNQFNIGSVDFDITSKKYQLILSGLNAPAQGDRVFVLYYPKEILRFQNLNYSNNLVFYNIDLAKYDGSSYYVPIYKFQDGYNLSFSIKSIADGYEYFSSNDGYLLGSTQEANFYSSSLDFNLIPNLLNYKITINDGYSTGTFDILSLEEDINSIKIGRYLSNLDTNNVFVYKITDGKEIKASSIDYENNKIILDGNVSLNDIIVYGFYESMVLKNSSSRVLLSINDNILNQGSISITGPTATKGTEVIFTATSSSYKVDLSEAIRKILNISSTTTIPSSVKLINVLSLDKVTESNGTVTSVEYSYDIKNSKLKNSYYFNEFQNDTSLNNFEIRLGESSFNLLEPISVGDKLRVTFYVITEDDVESINFSKNGFQYSNKKFMYVNKLTSSGFKNSLSTKINLSLFNEPNTSSRYKVTYDYLAPKQNERIIIKYNYNKAVADVTFAIENSRPINADVLVKQANVIDIGISVIILINQNLNIDELTIKQNVSNAITNAVNIFELGRTLEDIDIQLASDGVDGVDRTRVLYFNKYGESGTLTKIQSQNNEYFSLKELTINTEFR